LPTTHPGETGTAYGRTIEVGDIRVRMAEYTTGYPAGTQRSRGHVLRVPHGELTTELHGGRSFTLLPGKSCQVADHAEPHRPCKISGAKLFIVDWAAQLISEHRLATCSPAAPLFP